MPLNIPQNANIFPSFMENMQASEGNELELQRSQLANMFQQAQTDRYNQMTPLEVDKTGYEAAFAREKTPLAGLFAQQELDKGKKAAVEGNISEATQQQQQKLALKEMAAKMSKAQLNEFISAQEELMVQLKTALPFLKRFGPGGIGQGLQAAGIDPNDPEVLAFIEQTGQSGMPLDEAITKVHDGLMQSTEFLRDMSKEYHKGEVQRDVARIGAEASKYGADARKGDEEKAVNARRLAFQKGSPSVKYTTAMGALESGMSPFTGAPLDEAERTMLTKAAKASAEILNAANQARVAGNPNVGQMTGGNVPTYPIPQVGGQGTPQGQPKRYNPQTKTWE